MHNNIASFWALSFAIFGVVFAQFNVTVNDRDPAIQYEGQAGDALLCKNEAGNITFQPGCYDVPSNCASSVAMGQNRNDAASSRFKGTAIYMNSLLRSISPIYTITLDGKSIDVDGVRPSTAFICDTLFSKTGLDPTEDHEIRLSIKDVSPNRNLTIDPTGNTFVFSLIDFIYTAPPANSTSSAATNASGGNNPSATPRPSQNDAAGVHRLSAPSVLVAALIVSGWLAI